MKSRANRAFGVVAAAAAAALAVSAVAAAGPAGKQKRALRGAVHADVSLIRADGTTDRFTLDRGRVTARSPGSITLERADGKSVTLGVDAHTRILGRGDVAVGDRAVVLSRGGTAFLIRVRAPAP